MVGLLQPRWLLLLQLGRSDGDKDDDDDDEFVMKGTEDDSKLESGLLSSDLEFYLPASSASAAAVSPSPSSLRNLDRPADDTSSHRSQAKTPTADHHRRNADVTATNKLVRSTSAYERDLRAVKL